MNWIDPEHLLRPLTTARPVTLEPPLDHEGLRNAALGLAAGLQQRGVRRLAVHLEDAADLVIALLGAWRAGAQVLLPADLQVSVTRDYGETANEKANELLFHLGLATLSIVALIAFAVGVREALVTAIVIPTTILLTLFASNLMGYTINRVSLFALIFSIGILVDDAIVMIENIARHWAMNDGRSRRQAAIEAVAEVGNPTVVATLTVVAALLPMLFVSGLMGPYMAPIPVNASAAMVFSFFVAVVIAPWLMVRFARKTLAEGHGHEQEGRVSRLYRRVAGRVIATRRSAWTFLIAVGVATLLACVLFATRTVTVKLLPFDNKSELQVVADLPEGSTLEQTQRVLAGVARVASALPEVISAETVVEMADMARGVHVDPSINDYVSRLVDASRSADEIRLGVSVRGALALVRASKTLAASSGRYYVTPDDVKALAEPVLAHRLVLDPEAEFEGVTASSVVGQLLIEVPPPSDRAAV